MLRELTIKNFAIIEDLNIRFDEGLTVLSGETGAGKSIIINAVNLILGNRASSRLIRTGTDQAEIEALFDVEDQSSVAKSMETHGFEASEGLIIRRVISGNDRHRIYINGRMATIQILSTIAENLVSISGQHAHQGLLKEELHLLFLDQFGGLVQHRNRVGNMYAEIQPVIAHLNKLKSKKKRQEEHLELLSFQKKEIEGARLKEDEDTFLEAERDKLRHAEQLYKTLNQGVGLLYEAEGAAFERMKDVEKELEKAADIDPGIKPLAGSLSDVVYRLEDVIAGIRDYGATIVMDSTLLDETEERLDLINKLKRKYGGSQGTLKGVFQTYASLSKELALVENLGEAILDAEKQLQKKHDELSKAAVDLSKKRKKAAAKFSKAVESELKSLDMNGTQFSIHLESFDQGKETEGWLTVSGCSITETGIDKAGFMISPNVGEALRPLTKIASGGELSRVILALKAILAQIDAVDTVVFDEVDTGIGGGTADVVGKKIYELAKYHQVLCITHLPQIAKFGDQHMKILKEVKKGRTCSTITPLSKPERVDELARMLGGNDISKAVIEHAKELLEHKDMANAIAVEA